MFYILVTDKEFSDIFKKYNKYVYTVCKNTIERKFKKFDFPNEEIKDIVQISFTKFFLQLQKETEVKHEKSLLACITELTTINYLEKYIRENDPLVQYSDIDEEDDGNFDEPIDITIENERFEELISIIKSMNSKYSSVILLKSLHDMSLKEISDISNISYGTILSWHLRGKRLLAKKLSEKEGVVQYADKFR